MFQRKKLLWIGCIVVAQTLEYHTPTALQNFEVDHVLVDHP